MAIFFLRASIISRKKGRSCVASAAYQSREKLRSKYDGKTHDYRGRKDILHSEILLPKNAPRELLDRETLWNTVDSAESRKDARTARKITIALPNELTPEQQIELAQAYVKETYVDKYGMCADFSIHDGKHKHRHSKDPKDKDARGDTDIAPENPHLHIMLTDRPVDENGFVANKDRTWNQSKNVTFWREMWEEAQNRELERYGFEKGPSSKSYEKQGIDREGFIHEGHEVTALERKGVRTVVGDKNREIAKRNKQREEARRIMESAERDVQRIDKELHEFWDEMESRVTGDFRGPIKMNEATQWALEFRRKQREAAAGQKQEQEAQPPTPDNSNEPEWVRRRRSGRQEQNPNDPKPLSKVQEEIARINAMGDEENVDEQRAPEVPEKPMQSEQPQPTQSKQDSHDDSEEIKLPKRARYTLVRRIRPPKQYSADDERRMDLIRRSKAELEIEQLQKDLDGSQEYKLDKAHKQDSERSKKALQDRKDGIDPLNEEQVIRDLVQKDMDSEKSLKQQAKEKEAADADKAKIASGNRKLRFKVRRPANRPHDTKLTYKALQSMITKRRAEEGSATKMLNAQANEDAKGRGKAKRHIQDIKNQAENDKIKEELTAKMNEAVAARKQEGGKDAKSEIKRIREQYAQRKAEALADAKDRREKLSKAQAEIARINDQARQTRNRGHKETPEEANLRNQGLSRAQAEIKKIEEEYAKKNKEREQERERERENQSRDR